ncbi:hypothetical protein HC251_01305 [Iamia sp. SCSIO 61187]|uniref:hypothetical protein n=1 Tax=Iamia sp. SCSIO 61187 TaxID=2722752 RepID=UPI001C62C517|nr:hypothetical protein [Iamia sp. SCSIO 61187]QYG91204.1 hypothetical protein HC251_01305 [Iamia sp. SCSIO 61187]
MDVAPTPDQEAAIRVAHAWFGRHSGWAPPDPDTLADWVAEGLARCPDECIAAFDGWCAHGLASWWLILRDLEAHPGGRRTLG